MKHILVTGASSGIGLALVKRLATEHGCFVYLGSRNVAKGDKARSSIVDQYPNVKDQIEVINIDVSNDDSVQSAAKTLQEKLKLKDNKLYALVNNAGTGLAHEGVGTNDIININYHGPKRVTKAMLHLIHDKDGRIVNTSSGAASMWVRDQDEDTKAFYSDPPSQDKLDESVKAMVAAGNLGFGSGYALSKAALTALTVVHAKQYPNLKVVSLSPGFVDTAMTSGFNASLTPEQGCKSLLKCLLEPVTSGWYYGSDGLRSPLTCTRDPGTPEYQGEPNPDPAKYNK